MGIKQKITLAFSTVFIFLSIFFSFFGYRYIHEMLLGDNLGAEKLAANLRQLRTLLTVIVVLSILFSVTLSSILARLLLLPLQRIIHAAKNINTNSSRDPVPVTGAHDELHELSVSINEMM